MEVLHITSSDYKDQNRKSLPLEEFDMSAQEYKINRYDYKKWNIFSEANSYFFRKNTALS